MSGCDDACPETRRRICDVQLCPQPGTYRFKGICNATAGVFQIRFEKPSRVAELSTRLCLPLPEIEKRLTIPFAPTALRVRCTAFPILHELRRDGGVRIPNSSQAQDWRNLPRDSSILFPAG